MKIFWRDDFEPLQPDQWRGLLLTANETSTPQWQVQCCPPHRLRFAAQNRSLLWARIDDGYWGYELLRSSTREDSPGVLPPLTFSQVDALAHRSTSRTELDQAWAQTFAKMLASSQVSPLSNGQWYLGYFQSPLGGQRPSFSTELVRKVAERPKQHYVSWDLWDSVYPIITRNLSAPSRGRVKAWRKHARAGTLPPVLQMWISGLDSYVVLDGHDRLLAALLEGTEIAALCLQLYRQRTAPEEQQAAVWKQVEMARKSSDNPPSRPIKKTVGRPRRRFSTDQANALLIDVFTPRLETALSRARLMPGGIDQWSREVSRELDAINSDDRYILTGNNGNA